MQSQSKKKGEEKWRKGKLEKWERKED